MLSSLTPALSEVAHVHGVATEYWDWRGQRVDVSAHTIRAVLAALGVDASDDDAARAALRDHEVERWRDVLPPCVVTRASRPARVPVHLPEGTSLVARVLCEDGTIVSVPEVEHLVVPRRFADLMVAESMVEIPAHIPLGYHELEAITQTDTVRVPLICAPDSLTLPACLADHGEQRWGLMAQLYQTRSSQSWGIGDFADLADLGTWSAGLGADFMLVNPLHATEPDTPIEPSPYKPVSRRFLSPLYIRVEDIPEVGYLSSPERRLLEWHSDDVRRLNGEDVINRDLVWNAKEPALRLVFERPRSLRRERAFQAFCEREGEGLVDFATWCALSHQHRLPWTQWPAELTDPQNTAVDVAREEMAHEIEFYCWLQWIAEEQLEAAQREMRECGMELGIITDLAVGVSATSAEAWTLRETFAQGMTIGAPPDEYNQMGQDWRMPPMRPDRLAELAYQPFRDMLRTVLRGSGGIRVDHILGLFRLWWIPEGHSPTDGTYVRFDHEALVSVLALEAHLAGAVVIGEDLGTVEDWVRDYLRDRGIFGTSIMWFEWEHGLPKAPERYRELCLSTVSTHDLPPTAGYLEGVHIVLREALGQLLRPVDEEQATDEANREMFRAMLRERGLLREDASVDEQVEALHRLLTWTPSKLIGVAVSDLAGDRRAINVPGTDREYPNWSIPLGGPDMHLVSVEELVEQRAARRLARCVSRK